MTGMGRHVLASLAVLVLLFVGAAIAARLLADVLHPLLTH